MCCLGRLLVCLAGMFLGLNWFAADAVAGGSGLNTLVVVNQSSSNSLVLGNYYCERRQIPPENVLRIAWDGGNIAWDVTQFQTNLLQPLLTAIAARGLSNQIHFVVLAMDIPYQTINGVAVNGTTSSLFYGVKSNTGLGSLTLTNSYYFSEGIFPAAAPTSAAGYSFLTTMLTGATLAQAKQLVDQGVASDGTFPTAPVRLAKTTDSLRNLRTAAFNHVIFNTQLRGDYQVVRTNENSPAGLSGLLGYQTGLMSFSITPNTFVPGAMADSMTSFGGVIFGNNDQTTALAFIGAGAAGSYGTVTEPSATPTKFPDPQNYFFQARGFSLVECYYQSLQTPYQGLIVGEPLAAPFASVGEGSWVGLTSGAILSGTLQLTVQFTASDAARPLQQVDLFVDGKFFRTLTNIAPAAGNLVNVRIGGQNVNYTVPANATLASVATGLAAALNAPAISNVTKTVALAFGDRVELRQFATNRPIAPLNARVTPGGAPSALNFTGPAFGTTIGSAVALTTTVTPARSSFLDSTANGLRNCAASGSITVGTWLRLSVTKTNGAVVTVGVTNSVSGATAVNVLSNLVALLNAEPALQGPDGVVAEDYSAPTTASANFNLLARSPGLKAAGIKIVFTTSGTLIASPTYEAQLTANLADLQPRNHLYVSAGASNLAVSFAMDTAVLPDGDHELTAVAYEGSHVRTQTRVALPVRIQNTPLTAALNLVDLVATNPVTGSYSVQVTANTNNIASITLYSTGGVLGVVSNQAAATFVVTGTGLGVGKHPFYALIQDALGRRYRTVPQLARFQ
ncbi:MAG: TIGR03790 family protein [Verrucomicrobiota bacterium]